MTRGRSCLRIVHRRIAETIDAQTDLEVQHSVAFYSTVIAGVDEKHKVRMHGSGTLMKVLGRGVFLTAHHVVYGKRSKRGLIHFPGWCVWLSRYGQQPVYNRDTFVPVSIAEPTLKAGEPDLGAVLLPPTVVSDCQNNEKSFYSLDRRPVIEPEDMAGKAGALMVTAGAPIEYTEITPRGRLSGFLLGHGRTMRITRRHGYTFISGPSGISVGLPGGDGGGESVMSDPIIASRSMRSADKSFSLREMALAPAPTSLSDALR